MWGEIGAGLAAVSSLMSTRSHNRNLKIQGRQLALSTSQEYNTSLFREYQGVTNAREEAYSSALLKDSAIGRALVRGSTLGIYGNAVRDMIQEEIDIGNSNIGAATLSARDTMAAGVLGRAGTYADALRKRRALTSQAIGPLEGLLAASQAGLQGYQLGTTARAAFKGN